MRAGQRRLRRPQIRRGYRSTTRLRWAARRLELRSFGLVPEHFNMVEGGRAAVASGVPLGAVVLTGHTEFVWAVFAAFWTCLCDVPGPDRLRRHLLAIFVGAGTLVALAGSWIGWLAPGGAVVIAPALVFLTLLGAGRIAYGGLLGTLLAVVAVVAVGFPHPWAAALRQAGIFCVGAAWAYLLINLVWRMPAELPLLRARDAVVVRLLDMADGLIALGQGRHRDETWHSEHAEHRRAVRMAIERFRGLLDRYDAEGRTIVPVRHACAAAETLFSALIALDQAFIDQIGPAAERLAVTRRTRTALLVWRFADSTRSAGSEPIERALSWVQRLRVRLRDDLFVGCALAVEAALRQLLAADGAADGTAMAPARSTRRRPSGSALQQALRQSAGLVAVYLVARAFHLGYPYWAAMAVVVVLQGGARTTWARSLERIVGSLVGGAIASVLLHAIGIVPLLAVLATALAAVAIALRAVNYTLFVIFLTMMFVVVTGMLHPQEGVALARIVDNTVGSIAALLTVFVLWPDFGASVRQRIDEGIAANRAYFDAVEAHRPFAEIETIRRNAGLASIEAEVALHDLGGLLRGLRLPQPARPALVDLRTLAGRAAMAWHRRLAGWQGEGARTPRPEQA